MTKIAPSLKAASEIKGNDSISKSVPTFYVDPRIIVVEEGFNARPIDPEHVAHLKELKRAGIDTGFLTLQMIDGKPTLRDGHHRHAADLELIAEGVDIQKVKAIEFKGDEKAAILMMLATGSNKPYTPMQLGEQYVKLVNTFGMTYAEVAGQRGMSTQHVKDMIRLTEQPVELKAAIASGEVKAATALKMVKKEGATAALASIREARVIAPNKPITQKVIDNLAKNVVPEAQKRGGAAREHIEAMIDSPSVPAHDKDHLRDTLRIMVGGSAKTPDIPQFLATMREHKDSRVRTAAALLLDVVAGKTLPEDVSGAAAYYGHIVTLQDRAAKHKDPAVRAATFWYLAVLDNKRKAADVAPAPSVMSIGDALQAEKDSGGAVMAETLCPEEAAIIAWVRGRA
jgi:hypothetical protein